VHGAPKAKAVIVFGSKRRFQQREQDDKLVVS
jgi:hypothetical protein